MINTSKNNKVPQILDVNMEFKNNIVYQLYNYFYFFFFTFISILHSPQQAQFK